VAAQRQVTIHRLQVVPGTKAIGDSRQLVSALANLLDNAVKYSEPGSSVEIGASVHDAVVELTVEDHGIGIPARDHDRIFERFYRVDRARSRETGGTGLGLAIVRHVATNHGGEVFVRSREGVGSTFTLRIPSGEK
jgi:two-component system sensor histidine kinase SenX3